MPTLPPLPAVLYLTFKSVTAAAANATLSPGALAKWVNDIEEKVAAQGQFPKPAVAYIGVSPPPVFWDYKCRKCRAWGPLVGLPDRTCKWVAGQISPGGWCAIWLPPDSYRAFTWPQELLKGDW